MPTRSTKGSLRLSGRLSPLHLSALLTSVPHWKGGYKEYGIATRPETFLGTTTPAMASMECASTPAFVLSPQDFERRYWKPSSSSIPGTLLRPQTKRKLSNEWLYLPELQIYYNTSNGKTMTIEEVEDERF